MPPTLKGRERNSPTVLRCHTIFFKQARPKPKSEGGESEPNRNPGWKRLFLWLRAVFRRSPSAKETVAKASALLYFPACSPSPPPSPSSRLSPFQFPTPIPNANANANDILVPIPIPPQVLFQYRRALPTFAPSRCSFPPARSPGSI